MKKLFFFLVIFFCVSTFANAQTKKKLTTVTKLQTSSNFKTEKEKMELLKKSTLPNKMTADQMEAEKLKAKK